MHTRAEYVRRDAGLMSYGADFLAQAERGADFVVAILRGSSPATLPVDLPKTYELGLHLGTAEALGLTISPAVIGRADPLLR